MENVFSSEYPDLQFSREKTNLLETSLAPKLYFFRSLVSQLCLISRSPMLTIHCFPGVSINASEKQLNFQEKN